MIGHSICYDLRFPNLYRDMAQAGAEVLIVPSAFTKKNWSGALACAEPLQGRLRTEPSWSRACAVGTVEGGGEAYGHSLIVNTHGARVVADAGRAARCWSMRPLIFKKW